jgi:cysteine-S-conjugate beta-lyase
MDSRPPSMDSPPQEGAAVGGPGDKSLQSGLIHHPYLPPEGFASPQVPIYQASTVIFPSLKALRERDWRDRGGYTYGLHGTPSTFILESRLASLEGGTHCTLTPSGLSAIAHVNLALLKTGDEVLLPSNVYGPSLALARAELQQFGVSSELYDPLDEGSLQARLSSRTRLVWLEAAGSVTLEFPNLKALTEICHRHSVWCALDNTWGAGLAFNPFECGVDVSIHALTKYPSGGGDVLMGSIVTREPDLAQKIKLCHMRLGTGVGAHDVAAILKGLPSLTLRYVSQDLSARAVAAYLQHQPGVIQLLHPAFEGSPGHAHWLSHCVTEAHPGGLAAGIFSVVLSPQIEAARVDAFCESLKLFKLGFSWGGPMSLVVPYDLNHLRGAAPSAVAPGHLVRFCIGLEDPQDLIEDLRQGFKVLH